MDFQATLNKILRRTGRDVALAGAMCGSVSAMSKLFPTMEGYSTLTVLFYKGNGMEWTKAPVAAHSGAWNDFVRWYHGRPQSKSYVMPHKQGSQMFRRCDIRAYAIFYGERKQSSGDAERP